MFFFKRSKDPQKELKKLLNNYELPTFSTVVLKVLELLRDKEQPMSEIGKELSYDPSLVVTVFKMVNSSAFGLQRKLDNISQAVMLLGRARIESILLAHAVKNSLPNVKQKWFNMQSFWRLSAKRATLAKNLAQLLHPETAVHSFTAAMLQDMGVPVLVSKKDSDYKPIFEDWQENNAPIIDLEKDKFKFSHQEIGKLMGEEWQLPDYLVGAVSNHHNPDSVEPAIHLVSLLKTDNDESGQESILGICEDKFNMSQEMTKQIIDKSFEESESITL